MGHSALYDRHVTAHDNHVTIRKVQASLDWTLAFLEGLVC